MAKEGIRAGDDRKSDEVGFAIADELSSYTTLGYEIAEQSIELLRQTMNDASSELESCIQSFRDGDYQDRSVMQSLIDQLDDIKTNYELMPVQLEEEILSLPDGRFTVTLFGRTTAGKSTLMSILTNGDGSQIGRGAQRTTRDVRAYDYNGLKVVDVPGIAAFEGAEDEELAYEFARRSDLVLFLLAGDAQESEAECFSRIKELGKPIILIVNVKVGLQDDGPLDDIDMEDFEDGLRDEFDDRIGLEDIRNSLVCYGPKYGQSWERIPYVFVHLKSAFMSQQPRFAEYSKDLYRLSNFEMLRERIAAEIRRQGGYYRLKSFADAVAVPLVDTLEALFNQGAENSRLGRMLIKKRRDHVRWTDRFVETATMRIDSFVADIADDLKNEAVGFAESNYNNRHATQEWQKIVDSRHIEQRANELIDDLCHECDEELSELKREIDVESHSNRLVQSGKRIKAYAVIDAKKTWDWGTKILAGGLTLVGIFAAKELVVVGLLVGLAGELGDRLFGFERMKDEARRKMRDQLYDNIDAQKRRLRRELCRELNNVIVETQLSRMTRDIDLVVSAVFNLSAVQRNLARRINGQLRSLNNALTAEAFSYRGYDELWDKVVEVARIPGNTTLIVLADGARMPRSLRGDVGKLLGENIRYAFFDNDMRILLSRVIGRSCERRNIRIEHFEGEPPIVHIEGIEGLDHEAKTGIRLGEQVTELLVME